MRPGLTAKLFLAMLAVAVFAVLAMGVAARISFDRGFLGYLSEQETARMESVASSLTAAYREYGSWQFLRDNPRAWFEVMRSSTFSGPPFPGDFHHFPGDFGHGPPGHGYRGPPGASDQPPPDSPAPPDNAGRPPAANDIAPTFSVSDLTGASMRFTLLDAQQRYVFGNPSPSTNSHTLKHAIVIDGKTVGWLTMLPFRDVTEAGDLRFQEGQYHASWLIGAAALLIAALLAVWLARTLLTPVHRIAKATHALAKGDYSSRVVTESHDELGQLARDFNRLAVALERNEGMRRAFVADVSHELRTPLSIIRGELEAIEDGVRRFDADALKSLQMEVSTLSKLIDDLYQLSLADVGSMVYRKVEVDIGSLLAHITEAFQERFRKAGMRLELHVPPSPVTICADEDRLHQLFANLIENSVRYTDAGGTLRITCTASDDRVAVDLMDSAPGVDENNLSRLFERFYRVDASRNRASGGAGLGLAICRAIMEAHGGTIEAKPSPLGGLWVTVRLPMENS